MGKFFKVVKEKVKFPTYCPQGLVLKEVDGDRKFPVEEYLGDNLINKIGEEVEENIDFEVIKRTISQGLSNERTALLCDKGELCGGGRTKAKKGEPWGEWRVRLMDDKTEYNPNALTAIQHAERVSSSNFLEDIKWRKIRAEFDEKFTHIHTGKMVCEWFREKLKTNI